MVKQQEKKLYLNFLVALFLYGGGFLMLVSTNHPQAGLETDDFFESFHPEWHPKSRRDRFPSVEDRVKLYMSSWYLPPCSNDDRWITKYTREDTTVITADSTTTTTTTGSTNSSTQSSDDAQMAVSLQVSTRSGDVVSVAGSIEPDTEILLEKDVVEDCARSLARYRIDHLLHNSFVTEGRVHVRRNMRGFCHDVLEMFDLTENQTMPAPIVAMFGDESSHHDIPIFSKWRWVASDDYIKGVTERDNCWDSSTAVQTYALKENAPLPPILWKLGTLRHWMPVDKVRASDTDWSQKIGKAVWRGSFTGKQPDQSSMGIADDIHRNGENDGDGDGMAQSEEERWCWSSRRCQFVYRHASSELVDAGFVDLKGRIGPYFKGVRMKKSSMTMVRMQQYKVIVSLEGNDVASGLKWNLASQSVVLMAPPTKTSWAMEELLQPWVHYVPMNSDGSNAEEMVRWVIEHDDAARRIAERATLFMYDMLYHPDAESDETAIKQDILERYRLHWVGD